MLCLIKGQSGFVSLAQYPISTVVPLDLSSASSVERNWQDFKAACTVTAQQLLPPLPKAVKPWISDATLQLSQAKAQARKRCLDPDASPAAKAEFRRLRVQTSASAAADWQRFQDGTMEELQTSMRKGDTHTAYKVLQQFRKPSSKPAQRLRDKQGRFLLTPEQHSAR